MAGLTPLVLVQEGAGPFVDPHLGGLDVSPNAALSIKLQSTVDVVDWFLEVVGTDELSTSPTLTGVNPVSHKVASPGTTVTLTFPNSSGRAVGFKSTVTGLGGPCEVTFGTYSLIGGARVGFVGEIREGDNDFGWTTKLNPLIRSLVGGGNDNFSYKTVTVPIAVPIYQQMTVDGGIEIDDELDLIGELNLT